MIRNIQYLRGIAAIAVVFFHILLWEGKATSGMGVVPGGFRCGDVGVDLFFVISGFIMVYIQPQRLSSLSLYFTFLAHRCTRIYPPYWLVSLALLPIYIARPQLFNNFYHNQVDIFRSLTLLPQDYTPLLLVGWTLIHEVWFYLVVSCALVFGFRGRVLFGVTWFTLVLSIFALFGHSSFNDNRVMQLAFSPFSMTFILGYFLGIIYEYIKRANSLTMCFTLLLGIASLIGGFAHMTSVGVYPNNNHLFRFVAYGVPCFLIVGSCIGLERERARGIVFLKVLGDASYATYLLHVPIIVIFYAVIKMYEIKDVYILTCTAIVCLLTCLGMAIVFNRTIERRALCMCRRIIEHITDRTGRRSRDV